jgi:hypothetical protein
MGYKLLDFGFSAIRVGLNNAVLLMLHYHMCISKEDILSARIFAKIRFPSTTTSSSELMVDWQCVQFNRLAADGLMLELE